MDKSFTYMICSDDRTNTTLPAAGNPIFYNINFGGFSEQYESYNCEVLSLTFGAGILASSNYSLFCAENLAQTGYYCTTKLSRNDAILAVVTTSAVGDILRGNETYTISFRIDNCRMPKQVIFYLLKNDFTPSIVGTDINTGGLETKWVLTLKMTPIID